MNLPSPQPQVLEDSTGGRMSILHLNVVCQFKMENDLFQLLISF